MWVLKRNPIVAGDQPPAFLSGTTFDDPNSETFPKEKTTLIFLSLDLQMHEGRWLAGGRWPGRVQDIFEIPPNNEPFPGCPTLSPPLFTT